MHYSFSILLYYLNVYSILRVHTFLHSNYCVIEFIQCLMQAVLIIQITYKIMPLINIQLEIYENNTE